MGFIWIDGFGHYTAMPGSAGAKWDSAGTVANFSIDATGGRFSNPVLKCTGQSSAVYIQKGFTNIGPTVYLGLAWKAAAYPASGQVGIFTLYDGSTAQCSLAMLSTGVLNTIRGTATGTSLLQSSLTLSLNVWYYIEAKILIGGAGVGIFQIWVDGIEWIPSTFVNNISSANQQANAIRLFLSAGIVTTANFWIGDLYIHDSARQGDVRVQYRPPTGAGANSEWTPSSSVDNYSCVDEAPPSTVDYVEATDLDKIDSYEMQDTSIANGTVLAVVGNYYCQKTDAGSRQIAMVTELGSNENESTGKAVPSSWGYLQFIQETKPGGGAWTVDDSKDAEMGMKITV